MAHPFLLAHSLSNVEMPRYKLTIEYDGTEFVGWQQQDNGSSVQVALQTAAFNFCGSQIDCMAAGRTDSGVHALGQVVHLDLPHAYTEDTVRDALNAHLRPAPIAVLGVERVDDSFHARFSATRRDYHYVIVNRRTPLTVESGKAWLVTRPLDEAAMLTAGKHLIGRHDFTSFRSSKCQAKSPVKTLDSLELVRTGEHINIMAQARSFLHRQVRNIVGTLVMVGEGKIVPEHVASILDARNRESAGPCAPPDGLYLFAIGYD